MLKMKLEALEHPNPDSVDVKSKIKHNFVLILPMPKCINKNKKKNLTLQIEKYLRAQFYGWRTKKSDNIK